MLYGQREDRTGGFADRLGVSSQIWTHHGRMDHVSRGKVASSRQDGLADLDGAKPHGLFLDDDAPTLLESAGHTRPHRERRVRGVDYGVGFKQGDVTTLDR